MEEYNWTQCPKCKGHAVDLFMEGIDCEECGRLSVEECAKLAGSLVCTCGANLEAGELHTYQCNFISGKKNMKDNG